MISLTFFPLQSIQIVPRSPITDKEAKALFAVWNSEKDSYGYLIVPEEVDPMVMASLTSKGLVKNKPMSRVGAGGAPVRTVEITDKGKTIIRNIILHSEKSAFENEESDFDFNYEFIHRASQHEGKVAFTLLKECNNWLQRAFTYGNTT